jgi:AraC-like DNA-binding protein
MSATSNNKRRFGEQHNYSDIISQGVIYGCTNVLTLFDEAMSKSKTPDSLYTDVILSVFEALPWLNSFLEQRTLLFTIADGRKQREYISSLYNLLRSLLPCSDKDKIYDINLFVLNNTGRHISSYDVAKEFFLNYNYLSGMYKTKTGRNLRQYIELVCILRAYYLFCNTARRVYEVAAEMGFQNVEYFSGKFRKITGLSPSKLREIYKSGGASVFPPLTKAAEKAL